MWNAAIAVYFKNYLGNGLMKLNKTRKNLFG